jgi:hypothetical protein
MLEYGHTGLLEVPIIVIKLRKIFVSTTWNRKASPPLYGTKVSGSKKCEVLHLMVLEMPIWDYIQSMVKYFEQGGKNGV